MLQKRQIVLLGGIGGILLLLIILIIFGLRPTERKLSLAMWGVFDSEEVYKELLDRYQGETGVKVQYTQKSPLTYESEIVNALAAGRGPDIFMVQNSWIPKHFDKIQAAPLELFSSRIIEELYPQVVHADFTSGNIVWAVPMSVDTLALFYNRDLLDQAGIPFPPTTWEDLVSIVPKLVKLDAFGRLERQAVALGRARNINRATDILSLLMIQSGAKMVDVEEMRSDLGDAGREALQFFTQFARPQARVYTWSGEEHYSLDAFSEGTLALTFNYAYQIPTILAKSPQLNFGVSPMLEPLNAAKKVDYANYWGLAVARGQSSADQAWQLIAFLTDKPQAREYMRASGRPPARRDLIREVQDEKILGVFAKQALTATSWFQPDPEAVEDIFENMIEAVNIGRRTPEEAVREAEDRVNLLLTKFRQ